MAAELLLVNPRRRRRRKARAVTVRRNPRRKMTAKQRRFFGGRKRRRASTIAVASNPRRRRRSSSRSRVFRVRRNPLPASPMSNPVGYSETLLIAAGTGAGAGIVIDYLFAKVDVLAGLGPLAGPLAKLGIAAGLGMVVSNFAGKETGSAVAIGAATITAYDIIAEYLASQNAGGGVAGVGRYGSMRGMGRLGWVSPAKTGPMNGMGRYAQRPASSVARLQA